MTPVPLDDSDKLLFKNARLPWPYVRPRSAHLKPTPGKILSISDPHEPWMHRRIVTEAEKHKDAETLVIPGDLGDWHSKSKWVKTYPSDFPNEVHAVFKRLEWCATHFREVFIMLGNHDLRPKKVIQNLMQADPSLLAMFSPRELDLTRRLAKHFDNVHIVGKSIGPSKIDITHVWQLGDIVFTHAERSMAQKSSLLGKVSEQLHRWKSHLGLVHYSVVAQGHNHFAVKMTMGDETWFLLPMAANPYAIGFEYIWSPRMVGDPPCVGYTIFHQERGVTDINRSHNYLIQP